jgi:serine/threonine-protein kinase RsbT
MRVPTVCIAISGEMGIAAAILEIRRISEELGFGTADQSRVATAASELARNILKYAGTGHVTIASLQRDGRVGIEIVAADRGPGIQNIEQAMQDHFSSGGTLGLGLPGVRRLMDDFTIDSRPGQGTRVVVRKWK